MKKGGGGVDMDDDGDTSSSPPLAMLTIATSANGCANTSSQSGQFQKDSLTRLWRVEAAIHKCAEVIEKCTGWMHWKSFGWDGMVSMSGLEWM